MLKQFPHMQRSDPMYNVINEMIRKRVCECGYDPEPRAVGKGKKADSAGAKKATAASCPVTEPLHNHVVYPPYALLPKIKSASLKPQPPLPNRHWAFFLEIDEDIDIENDMYDNYLSGFSNFGERTIVHFAATSKKSDNAHATCDKAETKQDDDDDEYEDCDEDDDDCDDLELTKPTTFAWSDLKAGHTLFVLYAKRRSLGSCMGGNEGVRITADELHTCFVFKSNLENVYDEAARLLNDADCAQRGERLECFGCGIKCDTLSRCSSCKLAKYCSKECQTKAWKICHKKLCPQSETLLRLGSMQRQPFVHNFSFDMKSEATAPLQLPPYIYDAKFVYTSVMKSAKTEKKGQKANATSADKKTVEIERPTAETKCGLCNKTNQQCYLANGTSLMKTPCCNNWICDDEHKYVVGSYSLNSCARNHGRYTLCGSHFNENHTGKWQTCKKCREGVDEFDHNYVYHVTNKFNFEKLENVFKPTLTCSVCGFESTDLHDFAGQVIHPCPHSSSCPCTDPEFFCNKSKCRKAGNFEIGGTNKAFMMSYQRR